MADRKKIEEYILSYIKMVFGEDANYTFYKDIFASLDDEGFNSLMERLRDKKTILQLTNPNVSGVKLKIKTIIKACHSLGIPMNQRLKIYDEQLDRYTMTPIDYPVLSLPVRRQIQTLEEKLSTSADDKTIDELTGQPVGRSKGSRFSFVQMHAAKARNLDESIVELIKVRGGDEQAYAEATRQIDSTGSFSLEQVAGGNTQVTSMRNMITLFRAMHIEVK